MNSLNILMTPENHLISSDENKLEKLKEAYSSDLSDCCINMLTADYQLCKKKSLAQQISFTTVEALRECNADIFPNIHELLNTLVTLLFTTCAAKRSFLTMKYLKTY